MSRGRALWLALAAVVALGGALAGRALKGGGPEAFAFDSGARVYSASDLPAGYTAAGFTGFSETGGLAGRTLVAGRVTEVGPDSLTLSTSAGTNTIRLTGDEKLRVVQPFEGLITPGTTVVVLRKPGTDEAQALLLMLEP